MRKKTPLKVLSYSLSMVLAFSAAVSAYGTAYAASPQNVSDPYPIITPSASRSLTYSFSTDKAGYAEGTITLTADSTATYKLYWADDNKALDGYFPIEEVYVKSGESNSVTMGYHTAIPKGATKIIATTGSLNTADAYAVYNIPESRRLDYVSGSKLYSFTTFSDVHIDRGSKWYKNADKNLIKGLAYSVDLGSDYIVVSGDCVTNDNPNILDSEWEAYESILANSDFVNPIWESGGNHDLRQGVSFGLKAFIKGSGTDGSSGGPSYYYRIEEKTGDMFIFMSLDKSKECATEDVFMDDQLTWVRNLISDNYGDRNIFLLQHAPIKGFGSGDRMSKPYYGGLLREKNEATAKFKKILEDFPNIVFLSGHTHEDFVMGYNFFDNDGKAASMIHTPSLAGSTMPDEKDDDLDRNGGYGYHSQAYYTEVYQNEIVFYGVNVTDSKIYPKYSYIMEGNRTSSSAVNTPESARPLKNDTVDITPEVTKVSYILSTYYRFASYDSYQYLKKYYYQYKDTATADSSVIDEFEYRITELSKNTGSITYNIPYDTYYFVNTNSWSSVYAYAWDGSSSNAEWPGVRMTKVGTDANNKEVYKITFNREGEYKNIIFDGGSNTNQTVDISLPKYKYNAFSISGSDNGKYKVSNFNYDGTDSAHYAMLYYVENEHGWDQTDTYLKQENDVYTLTYRPANGKTFSCSFYDHVDNKYYCLSASQKFDFEDGAVHEIALEKMSSRSKSITVYGLDSKKFLDFEFNPSAKTVKITCRAETQPIVNNSTISDSAVQLGKTVTVNAAATGGTGNFTYEVSYKRDIASTWTVKQQYSSNAVVKIKPARSVTYDVCVRAKDSSGKVSEKLFKLDVFDPLTNETSLPESIVLGEKVNIYAAGAGGYGDYTYAMFFKKESESNYRTLQNYGDYNTASFKPAKACVYDVTVRVKDGRGAVAAKRFKVSVLVVKNTSTISPSNGSINLGEKLTVNCSAKGGTGGYEYAVFYKKTTDTNWTKKQDYSTNAQVIIKPARAVEYDICVRAKDSSGNVNKLYFKVNVLPKAD